ncbi:MAG: alpha/beta hydrolase [Myxococcales bacterium]|nr:MAG: alpha/beta hydrolase [Myxococcales bacterium]
MSSTDFLATESATCEERYLPAGDGVALRAFIWTPKHASAKPPVLFVAGWVSAVEGWADLLRALAADRPVAYIESREKKSAQIDAAALKAEEFTISRMAEDLIATAPHTGLPVERSLFMGSSLGATTILEALKHGRLKPRGAFLVGPNSDFVYPWWAWPIPRAPLFLYPPVKAFVLWHLRTFRVDVEREPEQWRRYEKTINSAEPLRLKLSVRGVEGYRVRPDLETVRVPVAVAYASTDKLHREAAVKTLVDALPRGRAVPCPTNKYMHSAELAADVDRFVESL